MTEPEGAMEIAPQVGTRPGHRAVPRLRAVLVAWLAAVAVDFGLHAGVLAPAYDWSTPFLLSPVEAFVRIPAAYVAFLALTWAQAYAWLRLGIRTGRDGAIAGAAAGALLWGAFLLALWSIATAEPGLLAAWWVGQAIELGVSGWVLGALLGGATMRWVVGRVVVLAVFTMVLALGLQAIGWANPPVVLG